MQHTLENPFPTLVKNLPETTTEVLIAVLVVWDMNSKQFEAGGHFFVLIHSQTNMSYSDAGVWPEQKFKMTQLVCAH